MPNNLWQFIDKHFERLLQVGISTVLAVPSWIIIMYWWQSQPHMILGTNMLSGIAGFWIGTSVSSALKDERKKEEPGTPPAG